MISAALNEARAVSTAVTTVPAAPPAVRIPVALSETNRWAWVLNDARFMRASLLARTCSASWPAVPQLHALPLALARYASGCSDIAGRFGIAAEPSWAAYG